MDMSKLAPAPWSAYHTVPSGATEDFHLVAGLPILVRDHAFSFREADADFIALARNFADVCERRGWSVRRVPLKNDWVVISHLDNTITGSFATLADAWQGAIDYDKKTTDLANVEDKP